MDKCKKLLQQNCKTCANNLGFCIGGNYGTVIPKGEKLTELCEYWSCRYPYFKVVECDGQCSMR